VTPVLLGILGQGAAGAGGTTAFESIATTTVGSGGASSITFDLTGVSGYTHLQIRGICKSTSTSTSDNNALLVASFNSDTTYSNYRSHTLEGNGSSASAFTLQQSGFYIFSGDLTTSNSSYSSMFAASIIDILDYTNTNKYKTVRILRGNDKNGSGRVGIDSGLWMNTSAITNVVLSFTNSNIAEYSQFALYGIKA
jgi:hypothetical protein